jgi:hypothetical protein
VLPDAVAHACDARADAVLHAEAPARSPQTDWEDRTSVEGMKLTGTSQYGRERSGLYAKADSAATQRAGIGRLKAAR